MKHHIHRSSQIFTAYSWHRSAFAKISELVSAGGWVDLKKVAKEDQDPGAPCLQLPKVTKAACTDLLKLTYLLSWAMNEHWKKKLCESSKCKVELSLLKVVPLPRQNETRTLTIFGLFDVQYQTKMIYFLRWTTPTEFAWTWTVQNQKEHYVPILVNHLHSERPDAKHWRNVFPTGRSGPRVWKLWEHSMFDHGGSYAVAIWGWSPVFGQTYHDDLSW